MFKLRVLALAMLTLAYAAESSSAQSFAFTYQGQLKEEGAPVNGNHNFVFKLFDAANGGGQIGPTIPRNAVPVTHGMINETLDFGATAFTGAPRWLEITADGVVLTPRQPITPVPYALFAMGPWQASGVDISNTNAGNVGIGVNDPTSRLEIGGQNALSLRGFQPFLTFRDSNAGLARSRIQGVSGDIALTTEAYINSGGANPGAGLLILKNTTGNVGISSANPASKLEIVAQDALAMIGFQPFLTFRDSNSGFARSRIQGVSGDIGLTTEAYIGSGGANPGAGLLILKNTSGNVGIGTAAPTSKLEIAAQDGLAITGFQPFLTLRDTNAGGARSILAGGNGDFGFYPNSFIGGAPAVHIQNQTGNMIVSGDVSCRVLTVRGADVAEKFPSTEKDVEPGTVMEIDPDQPGKVRVAREAYSSRVAGVVSGAGNLPAGAVLGSSPENEGGPAIALSGRVWVRCDASANAIAPGDLLTSSATAGHAMKAADRDLAHGTVLGKAMSPLSKGDRGLVLVLVNLQ